MSTPLIHKCFSVYLLRSVHTGKGICIGFTNEQPSSLPDGDVIHMCWLSKESIEKRSEKNVCHPLHRISCTPNEAERIGVNFIRAAALYTAEVKKDEQQTT